MVIIKITEITFSGQQKQQPPPSPLPTTIYYLLSETTRILSTHRRHFLILTLLFILPPSLFATIYSEWSILYPKTPTTASLILSFVLNLLFSILSLLAIGSVSFSSYNFLLGRPIKPATSIHSLLRSFPRLLITYLTCLLISFLVLVAFGLLAALIIMIEPFLFKIDQLSLYISYSIVISVMFGLWLITLIYLSTSWGLWAVVVVIESKHGFQPLQRSAQLLKGNKRIVLLLSLSNAAILMGFLYGFLYLIKHANGDLKSLLFVLSIAVNTGVNVSQILVSYVAITVLYFKVAHGEYNSLPLADDDEKASILDSHVMAPSGLGMA